jgi:predicted RNA-binding Zn-ribbon protein involved in translation (DUF1610 family)
MGCPNCGFTSDQETGDVYDCTYPCPNCGKGGALILRVASRHTANTFNVNDLVWMGKYKNSLCKVLGFGVDAKGNPTVTLQPMSPSGKKQPKTIGLFRIWKVRPEQIPELKAKGKLA